MIPKMIRNLSSQSWQGGGKVSSPRWVKRFWALQARSSESGSVANQSFFWGVSPFRLDSSCPSVHQLLLAEVLCCIVSTNLKKNKPIFTQEMKKPLRWCRELPQCPPQSPRTAHPQHHLKLRSQTPFPYLGFSKPVRVWVSTPLHSRPNIAAPSHPDSATLTIFFFRFFLVVSLPVEAVMQYHGWSPK